MALPKIEMGTGFDDDDDFGSKKKQNRQGPKTAPAGPMPLDVACHEGNLSQVILCWAQGLSLSQPDQQGYPPIMWAALKNQVAIARFLLDNGASPNASSEDGQTALMWAATEGSYEVGKLLIESGADPTQTDRHGYTAACIAVQNGNFTFLHMLHCLKALDPLQTDSDGHHLTTWACYKGEFHILEYLHQIHKVPLNGLDKTRRTALHWAAREGYTDCVIYLLANGAPVSVADDEGLTALQYAQQRNHYETVTAIQKNVILQPNPCVGSLTLIATNRTHMFNCAAVFVYFFVHYHWSNWILPIWAHFPVGLYFAKNMWYNFVRKTPVRNSVPEQSILADLGAPKTLMGSLRGPAQLRRREVANVFAAFLLLFVQYYVAVSTSTPLPALFLPILGVVVLAAAICKASAFSSVIENGTIQTDPSLPVIERGEYRKIIPRVYDQIRHVKIPLRAFYCQEIDRVVKRYDSFSVLLDCPISSANHRSFMVVLVGFFLIEFLTLLTAYEHLAGKHCTPTDSFSLFRFFWNMGFSNLPCPVKLQTESWEEWFVPRSDNIAGCWLLSYTLPASIWAFTVIMRQLAGIVHGVSRAELADPTAPTVNGDLEPINRGRTFVFSDSGKVGNFIMWVFGRSGERWDNIQALPSSKSTP